MTKPLSQHIIGRTRRQPLPFLSHRKGRNIGFVTFFNTPVVPFGVVVIIIPGIYIALSLPAIIFCFLFKTTHQGLSSYVPFLQRKKLRLSKAKAAQGHICKCDTENVSWSQQCTSPSNSSGYLLDRNSCAQKNDWYTRRSGYKDVQGKNSIITVNRESDLGLVT